MGSFRHPRVVEDEKLVLAAATELGGIAAARLWYDIPLPDIDGLSPRQLVESGRAREVFEYLALLESEIQPWERPVSPHPYQVRFH